MSVKLIIKDEVNIKFQNLPLDVRKKLANKFKYVVPHAKYHPAYRLGRWDGTVSYFTIGGTGYIYQLEEILKILSSNNIEIDEIEDNRKPIKFNFPRVTENYWADLNVVWPAGHQSEGQPIILRDYQIDAINTLIQNPQCLMSMATGSGKTLTTATLSHLCEPYGRTIIIVPNKSLVEQTEEDYRNCGLDVGVYYGDRKELNRTHTICTWQSLNILDKKSKAYQQEILTLAEFLDGVNAVIVDECHGAVSAVLQKLLTENLNNASIRWGLTGTVPKDEYQRHSLFNSIGPCITGITAHELQEEGVLSKCHVNAMQLIDLPEFKTYADEQNYLVINDQRVEYISNFVKELSNSGNTLVLVNRIETGNKMKNIIGDCVFISGSVKTKDRKAEYDEVKVVDDKIIIATYGVAAVGINIVRIHNLVLVEPGKSFTRVIQSIGRGLRKGFDKDHVEIYDISSTCKFSKRHLTERKKFYREAQYPFTQQKINWTK